MRRTARGVCLLGFVGALFVPAAPPAFGDDASSPDSQPAAGQRPGSAPSAPVWVKGPMGKLYPVGGWKSCAEAAAHADVPMMKGDPGYNPALDPAGSGFACV